MDDRSQISFISADGNSHIRVERSPPEPLEKPLDKPNQPSEVQDMQQQPKHLQQPLQPQSQQPVISINTTSSANVSYSTETVTSARPTITEPSMKKYKPDDNKAKKNYTIIQASTTDSSAPHLVRNCKN